MKSCTLVFAVCLQSVSLHTGQKLLLVYVDAQSWRRYKSDLNMMIFQFNDVCSQKAVV